MSEPATRHLLFPQYPDDIRAVAWALHGIAYDKASPSLRSQYEAEAMSFLGRLHNIGWMVEPDETQLSDEYLGRNQRAILAAAGRPRG